MNMNMDRPPAPGRLRYIALLSLELKLPEPYVDTDAQAIRELNSLLAEKKRRRVLKQHPFAKAVYNTLASHGSALNYEYITKMVNEDHPELHATPKKVLALLQGRKDLFRRVTAGTFFLSGKLEGKEYPLM